MEFFSQIYKLTSGHISNFFDTMKFGITGTKYGALPRTEAVVDIRRATQTSKVPRFASYDINPSYIRLYSDTYSYDHPEKELKHKKDDDDDDSDDDNNDDDDKKKDYVKDLDATQAAFIVIKETVNKYIVHLLFTRDTRIEFLKGKIPTILLRVLLLVL